MRVFAAICLICLTVSGCATTPIRNPVPQQFIDTVQVVGLTNIRHWGDKRPDNLDKIVEKKVKQARTHNPKTMQKGARPKLEYLAISGGADDGAFGAGLLVGWTKKGNRPKFDIVTGVSTGALIAPFAFLGSSYDPQLREVFTQYGTKDLISPKPVIAGILGGQSVAGNEKLAALIKKYISQNIINAIAKEYHKGRRLLVGTTNLDAQRPVIWDMTKIAASNTPEALTLFRKVLLASAAIPGIYPPVHINVTADGKQYEEMHVDGGATSEVFLVPTQIMFSKVDRKLGINPIRTLYIIRNGFVNPEFKATEAKTMSIAARSISTMIKQQTIGDLYKLYAMAQRDKINYRLAAIPDDFKLQNKEPFDKQYMNALFDKAYQLGEAGYKWATKPPGF